MKHTKSCLNRVRFTLRIFLLFAGLTGTTAPAADAKLEIATDKAGKAAAPKLRPATQENVIVYKEAGRYGGWPANHGLWQWGDELVAGFTSTWYKQTTTDHRIDRTKPSYEIQARSLDGGKTWKAEEDLPFADPKKEARPAALTVPIDFTAPDFALMFRFGGLHAGPSWLYTSLDRCKTWQGPYSFAVEGVELICTRTDLIVLGKRDCLMFGSCAKQNDGKEGRVFCARTTDLRAVRKVGVIGEKVGIVFGHHAAAGARGRDDVVAVGEGVHGLQGVEHALVQLQDGRVAVTYGFRHKPSGMRASLSADGGVTWGPEIVIREDGYDGDLGYPRSLVRPDGKVLTVYYFNGPKEDDRAIEGTFWTVPQL